MERARAHCSGVRENGGGFWRDLGDDYFFRKLRFWRALLLPLEVIKTGERPQQNVERIIQRQMPEDPFGQALEKHAAKPEENAHPDSAQGSRGARPQKTGPHLEPAQPK